MSTLQALYRHSLVLLTDLYQLTMAHAYWKSGMAEREAVFNLSFRKNPFGGGYTVACGLGYAQDFLADLRFGPDDLAYLQELTGNDGKPLFERAFLDYLGELEFTCDVDAVPEGTVVFPFEPMARVTGSVLQAQLIETPLLNHLNFQSLVATKAARICQAAEGEPVLEFGLRRAQGVDGALAASRAAYVGGCASTSNVLAGKLFGIPVRGTHAHSWVMCFASEREAFAAYAAAEPNNCVFLVDTYDSLQGVRNAIEVGKEMRRAGHEPSGIRLDSGDLAYLSIESRKLLDAAGFEKVFIVASNDLDEGIIQSLKQQGAEVSVWGVGTKLATAWDQPALGGVYKLAAIRDEGGAWVPKVKLSEQSIKTSIPGPLQVRRFTDGGQFVADAIYAAGTDFPAGAVIVDPMDETRRRRLGADLAGQDLLVPVVRKGKAVLAQAPLGAARDRVRAQLASFHAGVKRFVNPHQYPVGLEKSLYDLRTKLILEARGVDGV